MMSLALGTGTNYGPEKGFGMQKFDRYEPCPACGNDPEFTGLMWRPKFKKRSDDEVQHLQVSCGQCKYTMKRATVNEV